MLTTTGFVLDDTFLAGAAANGPVPNEVAIVGAGRWAKVLCKVLAQFSPAIPSIVLVAERNTAAAERWVAEQQRADALFDRVTVVPLLRDVLGRERAQAAFVTKMTS